VKVEAHETGFVRLARSGESLLWDALIGAAAPEIGREQPWSEDMQDSRRAGPLAIVDPFAT
jgi:predicted nucleic acid-binding protein